MELQRLRYFVAVAEEQNFRRAADRLDIAQPPLSRHIAQLEKEVGTLLFDRSHSQIRLTQAGEKLLEGARNLFAQLDRALDEVRRIGSGSQGILRIAFVGSSTHGVLPSLIKSYRAQFPNVDLGLSAMNNASLTLALIQREIDVAIARPSIDDKEVKSEFLHREPLILALPDNAKANSQTMPRLADLHQESFILYPANPRPSFADHILGICRDAGIADPKSVMAMDYQTAISLVSVGVGVSIVPESVSTSPRAGVSYRKYEGPNPSTDLSVNYRRDNHSPHLRGFLEVARRYAKESAARRKPT
ncbi:MULTISPECIES: LysR family transcriptional regulator [unclassified Bradyrhizobium]|uniref:LysR substrate-binding domain-containing protein n=1 Tax=unclassified Bradyrhizobium TaxID=2631580 RepID=UPI00244C6EBA|nr:MULTISPECIES: LysR family transcriptional regulator [unclassified Bradyrhizobium]MDH2346148.1 LysR family transcriptional regulator [Bradyrhizobium sp. SSUT77]MDH2350478.1 LysR family transcriptional regulator [Bradyrhizobium sp. SSUT112]